MIEVIRRKSPNKYGRFFLVSEADVESQTQEEIEPKFNTRLINIKPSNRGKDFTKDIEDDPVEQEEIQDDIPMDDEGSMDAINPDDISDQNIDYTSDTPEIPHEDPNVNDDGDTQLSSNPDNNSDTDFSTDDPTVDDNRTDLKQNDGETTANDEVEVSTDADYTGADEPVMDDQDYTSDDNEDNSDAVDMDPSTVQDPNVQQPKGPGLEYDSTRKYLLFKNFMSLYNAIENYITKLESCIADDIERNKIVMSCIEKLREVKDLCHDYMLMKFEISTYIQSLLFFQNLVVMVQMIFGLLNKNTKKNKK